jgi:MurNAc alpha-1-phosphate uridylyltransferase
MAADTSCMAHVVMVPNPDYHPLGDWALNAAAYIDPAGAPRLCYANMAVVKPTLLSHLEDGTIAPLGPILADAARSQKVTGELYLGAWFNVGTPEELEAANKAAYRSNEAVA